ncbi:hypothetical protein Pcinc_002370 [Petrolisthes cinctipes]|uniref:PiggyBac transposable element-derived protein domain-containing protein n=1 Tax=Petrolisthes cinctipes TaxID=88211 RepID=A0AAE1GIX2_PETCI|nr:hypothetical protein Pcinc_002370 [Petrolisthes cinctipes]
MAGRSEENTGSFDSVHPTALPGAPAPVTSTPRVQPARLRHAPARLSDSAIGRELENLADLSYGSDDLDSYSDTEWQADESTEEDACVAVTSLTALLSTSALHDVSEVTAPVAIPSTSGVGGTDVDVPADDPLGFSGSVVKALMGDYLDNNHILYTDNYYTSPALSQFLLQHQTGSCGTIRVNRKGWPAFPLTRRGDCIKKKCGNMLAIKWHDKRPVNMLTTVNRGVMQDSGKTERGTGDTIYKPDAVLDYNINMRLVDKSDMMVSSIDCLRKTCKWYKKAFFHLLDVTVLNCYILYLQHHPDSKLALREFELELISQLLERFSTVQPQQGRQAAAQRPDRLQQSGYMARHYLTNLPPLPSGCPGSRRCYVCRHTTRHPQKSKETRFWCKECCVPLCPGNCFSDYHILEYI